METQPSDLDLEMQKLPSKKDPATKAAPLLTPGVSDSVENKADDTVRQQTDKHLLDMTKEYLHNQLLYRDRSGDKIINLATLQRMILGKLQYSLMEEVGGMGRNADPSSTRILADAGKNTVFLDRIQSLIAAYAQAVRDWDLMVDHAAKAGRNLSEDPFLIVASHEMTRGWMMDTIFRDTERSTTDSGDYFTGPREPLLKQRHRINRDRKFESFLERLLMAIFGGTTLVGPMLLMVLHDDRTTALVTTCVAVLLFAVFVALFSTGSPIAIVSAVAAYSAVMVVFVGTNIAEKE